VTTVTPRSPPCAKQAWPAPSTSVSGAAAAVKWFRISRHVASATAPWLENPRGG
jgi:hypothetical protein